MEACGIIAEYNPLHRGHIYHLQTTKKLTRQPLVLAMSGSFMQRGEPAILDKFTRAKIAVCNGADLVLELPTAFTLRSAQFFAEGGVSLLKATGIVNTLSCGTEHPDYPFQAAASYMGEKHFQTKLHELIGQGTSYATACSDLLNASSYPSLKEPNDILALEYSKALSGSPIKPLFIQRQDQGYNNNSLNSSYASASAIRNVLLKITDSENALLSLDQLTDYIPPETLAALKERLLNWVVQNNNSDNPLDCSNTLWKLLQYQLILKNSDGLKNCTLVSEGMENLLSKASCATSLNQAINLCVGKRYPASRIRRLFCQLLLDMPSHFYNQKDVAYIKVLAFNDTGREILKAMKHSATLPILTKIGSNPFTDQPAAFCQQLELDLRATECWNLLFNFPLPHNSDYVISPSYIK